MLSLALSVIFILSVKVTVFLILSLRKLCKLDIEQEEFCFDIAYDDEGASLLVNSNEQMIAEKLKSLLKFGTLSSRYKDIFDIYYLSQHINKDTMRKCFKTYIFDDPNMREKDLNATDINWLEEDIDVVISGIISFIKKA